MKKGKRYLTEGESTERILKKAERKNFLKNTYDENLDVNKNRSIQVSINGYMFESVSDASRATGLSDASIHRSLKKLNESSRSEMEFEIKTAKTYIFKKIK